MMSPRSCRGALSASCTIADLSIHRTARSALARGGLHFGERHQHLSAGFQVLCFEKGLFFLRTIGAYDGQGVDQVLARRTQDGTPVGLELVRLEIALEHAQQI